MGNFISVFLSYDCVMQGGGNRSYTCIRVAIDVRLPLKHSKKVQVRNDTEFVVLFKYERLSMFCFLCGKLGHSDTFCEFLFGMQVVFQTQGQDSWLWADARQGMSMSNLFLRYEDGHSLDEFGGGFIGSLPKYVSYDIIGTSMHGGRVV